MATRTARTAAPAKSAPAKPVVAQAAAKSAAPAQVLKVTPAPVPDPRPAATAAGQSKPAAKPAAPVVKPAKPAKDKPAKVKVVRDSFTIPKSELAVLQALKDRAASVGRPAKKSELLRAGIQVLAGLPDSAFTAAVRAVEPVKTGRPAKG